MAKALIAAGTMIPKQAPVAALAGRPRQGRGAADDPGAGQGRPPALATEGTAAMIEALGLPVRAITKRLSEGHPNVLDAIEQGWVGAVINTVTGRRGPLKDGFQIRRAAVERRIPCFTSIDTARVAVEVVDRGGDELSQRAPLAEYVAGRRRDLASRSGRASADGPAPRVVTANDEIMPETHVIDAGEPAPGQSSKPGQFVHIRCVADVGPAAAPPDEHLPDPPEGSR